LNTLIPYTSLLSFSDYVCTETDIAIIESVKKIPSSPGKEELVLIDDVPVSRNHMECLFQPQEYLSDEVTYANHNTQSDIKTSMSFLSDGKIYAGHRCLYYIAEGPGGFEKEARGYSLS
jgi:hypothetical protein